MGLQTSFDVLSRIVEQYESNGRSVRRVEATTGEADEGTLHVTMDIPVSLCSASNSGLHSEPELTPETATLTDEGGLQVEFSTSILATLPPATAAAVSASNRTVRVTDAAVLLTAELTIDPTDDETQHTTIGDEQSGAASAAQADESSGDTDRSSATSRRDHDESRSRSETSDDLAAVRDESVPPYEDTAYLRRLYDSCDTFTEMSRKIEMDVTSETVRRYMIETDIHNPTSYSTVIEEQVNEHQSTTETGAKTNTDRKVDTDTNTDREAEVETTQPALAQSPSATDDPTETTSGEQLVTDGIGLPEGLQIEDVMNSVVDSVTVYEVQRHLGLERQHTQELLEQLNLLDLVVRRITDNPERAVSYEEVATRIRQCTVNRA